MTRSLAGDYSALLTAEAAAEFQLWVARQRGRRLTHRELQNLLYLAQGMCYLELERPLFAERIDTSKDGPVIDVVDRRYGKYEERPIPCGNLAGPTKDAVYPGAFFHSVLNELENCSATGIAQRIESGRAWTRALATTSGRSVQTIKNTGTR